MQSCLAKADLSYEGLSDSQVPLCAFWQDRGAVSQDACSAMQLGFYGLAVSWEHAGSVMWLLCLFCQVHA